MKKEEIDVDCLNNFLLKSDLYKEILKLNNKSTLESLTILDDIARTLYILAIDLHSMDMCIKALSEENKSLKCCGNCTKWADSNIKGWVCSLGNDVLFRNERCKDHDLILGLGRDR